jgi:hypothetical protein
MQQLARFALGFDGAFGGAMRSFTGASASKT